MELAGVDAGSGDQNALGDGGEERSGNFLAGGDLAGCGHPEGGEGDADGT